MHNIYSFNALVVSNEDKRERRKVSVAADGGSLNRAWDKAERKLSHEYPNHVVIITMGNRQPVHLRPSVQKLG